MRIEHIFDECLAQIVSLKVLYSRLKTKLIMDLSTYVINSGATQCQPDFSMEQFTAYCIIEKRIEIVRV